LSGKWWAWNIIQGLDLYRIKFNAKTWKD
jgi:hypothetical protein